MYTYKIKEADESDALNATITKEGITADFKLQDVYNHKLKLEQEIKEKEGQVEIAKASMTNILENHEDVKEIIKDIRARKNAQGILATLFLYIKHDIDKDNNKRMIDERKTIVSQYDEELDLIHKELNIAKPIKVGFTKANKE
jgi:hypothetical protein